MATRVAINGFGRVGRAAFRAARDSDEGIEFVAINDLADGAQLVHLLRYDSVYGRLGADIDLAGDTLTVDELELPLLREADTAALPWSELDVDVVLECTGRFRTR